MNGGIFNHNELTTWIAEKKPKKLSILIMLRPLSFALGGGGGISSGMQDQEQIQ